MLEMQNISLSFKTNGFVLNVSHLELHHRQIIGVVGNNGAGKTTFLRLILDLIKPDTGEVKIEGLKVDTDDSWKKFTGVYLDEYSLIDFLTAREYLDFVAKINYIPPDKAASRLLKFRQFYDIADFSDKKYISEYSTGNKHKIGIVAALLATPKLVLLDEPFANLDPSAQIALKNIIRLLNQEDNTCFIISSHNLDHIVEISERMLLFENGNIIEDAQVTDSMQSRLVRYFSKRLT